VFQSKTSIAGPTDSLQRHTRGEHHREVLLHHVRNCNVSGRHGCSATRPLTRLEERILVLLALLLEERESVELDDLIRHAASSKLVADSLGDEQCDLFRQWDISGTEASHSPSLAGGK
jgi:hypothetical protein